MTGSETPNETATQAGVAALAGDDRWAPFHSEDCSLVPEDGEPCDCGLRTLILDIEAQASATLKAEVRDADAEIRALRADLAAAYKFIRRRLGHYALQPLPARAPKATEHTEDALTGSETPNKPTAPAGRRLTTTEAGHDLVVWIGYQWHDEGTIPEDMAQRIRAAVVAIEAEAVEGERARLRAHEPVIDYGYELFTCSCGYDFGEAPDTERFLDHALLAEATPKTPPATGLHIDGLGCWCHPYRDAVEPELIVHRKAELA